MACLATACVSIDRSPEAAALVRDQSLGDLPYHPVVMQLDLSIYAYQLHGQSLVWPFDPYYEQLATPGNDRDAFMSQVRDWMATVGADQDVGPSGLEAYRGPGLLSGLPDNPDHDPILYQYSRLDPWVPAIVDTNDSRWTEYLTPRAITERVASVQLCIRSSGGDLGQVAIHTLPMRPEQGVAGAEDVLMVFEGGTGDKGEEGQPASQSLMGLALLRHGEGDAYDVHIAFRGSRSGSAARAVLEAISTQDATGNPDWITDLGFRNVDDDFVSLEGEVSRGMSRAVELAAPQLLACLDQVATALHPEPPRHIYVTGHSLGGGLAQHFLSAVLLGDSIGPGGPLLPSSLVDWPWENAKLVTFGAPRVGERTWARALTDALDAPFFNQVWAYDASSLGITDPSIVPRLLDEDRPAAFRVLVPTDPVTSSLVPGTFHVGTTVYLTLPEESFPPDGADHEPAEIRRFMTETLRDPDRIPTEAWRTTPVEDWSPQRGADEPGSLADYETLIDANQAYYLDRGLWFDHDAFEAGVEVFRELLDER